MNMPLPPGRGDCVKSEMQAAEIVLGRVSADYNLESELADTPLTLRPTTIGGKSQHKQPELLWTSIAKLLMSPSQYLKVWQPHIEDMLFEYDKCISAGDKRGARLAVIRAHFYSVPSWAWGVGWTILMKLAEWLKVTGA